MEKVLEFLYSLHFHPVVFGIQIVLFIGFHYTMKSIIYGPLLKARNEREGRIDGHLAKAEASAANARSLKQKYEEEIKAQRLADAQQLKEAIDKAEKEAAARMQTARDEAGRIIDEANARLNEEEAQLKAGMDSQASKLAVAVASKVVRNSLKEDAQDRVLQQLKG